MLMFDDYLLAQKKLKYFTIRAKQNKIQRGGGEKSFSLLTVKYCFLKISLGILNLNGRKHQSMSIGGQHRMDFKNINFCKKFLTVDKMCVQWRSNFRKNLKYYDKTKKNKKWTKGFNFREKS